MTTAGDYLNTEQAGELIGMSADYIARQCKSGAIKAKKLGSEWRIRREAIEQFMGSGDPAPATRKRLTARQRRRAA